MAHPPFNEALTAEEKTLVKKLAKLLRAAAPTASVQPVQNNMIINIEADKAMRLRVMGRFLSN